MKKSKKQKTVAINEYNLTINVGKIHLCRYLYHTPEKLVFSMDVPGGINSSEKIRIRDKHVFGYEMFSNRYVIIVTTGLNS